MIHCHGLGGNQLFALTENQMIATQNSDVCIGINKKLNAVVTVKCMDEEPHLWKYYKEVLSQMKE